MKRKVVKDKSFESEADDDDVSKGAGGCLDREGGLLVRLRTVMIHGWGFNRTGVVSRSFPSVTPHEGAGDRTRCWESGWEASSVYLCDSLPSLRGCMAKKNTRSDTPC